MSKKINIDIWRFIVSFLIVAIHISPFAKISPKFDFFFTRILGRIAVPLFLMITGYYILDRALKDKEDLINELFDISRFNAETIILSKEELNLTMMLEQIVDDFYPILKENNKEITIKSDDKIIIYADSDKIARVFGNIIKNAINYSINNDKIEIEVKKDNQNVIVKVKNKGAKIPEEKLKRIFEKFYRADSSRTSKTGGSGLGLAIAKEIVELHNGKIIATSNDLETVFEVVLPLCKN